MIWGAYTNGDAPRGRPWFLAADGAAARDKRGRLRWFASRRSAFHAWLALAGMHDEFDYLADESSAVDRAAWRNALVSRGRTGSRYYCLRLNYRLGESK